MADDDPNSSSQLSLPPASSSEPASSSSPYDGSSSGFQYDGESSEPSVGNAPQDVENSSSSAMQSESSSPENNEEEDDDINADVAAEENPKSPAGKEPMADNTAVASSSSGLKREGKAQEIGLLTELYNLRNRLARYHVLAGSSKGEPDFYKFLIEEEKDYANKEEVDNKIEELHLRYLRIMKEDVDGPTDPIDVEILRLSEWIWGSDQIESPVEETDQEKDLAVDDSHADYDDDLSKHETAKKKKKTEADDNRMDDVDDDDVHPIKKD